MTSSSCPVVLFGIDGATFSVLDPLMSEGKLPNLSRLKQEGAWGMLQSTIHPITPAAWVSMVTGLNPGKHGVYDFWRRKNASYNLELVNSRSWSGEPVWSILGRQDKKAGIFNVPMTYPPQAVNGFMVSGMGTPPTSQNFIYPASLATKFQVRFPTYAIEPDTLTTDLNEYLYRNEQLLEQCLEALQFVRFEYPDLDFFMPVFIVTDRIQHVYWRFIDPNMPNYYDPSALKIRERVGAVYQRIDTILGELWAWVADRRGYLLVVSDHGFGPLLKDVYLNQWLIDQGYLKLKPNAAFTGGNLFDQVDWDKTRAYSFGLFGNINLNLYGREPHGLVNPGREAETLKQEIIAHLSQLTDPETNEIVVDAIFRKEELYSGVHLDQSPDLLIVMKEYGYMTRDGSNVVSDKLMGPPMEHMKQFLPHSGNHRMDGVIFMVGEGIKPGFQIRDAVITDVAPTVLYLASSPVPSGLDGQILLNAFQDNFVTNHPPAYVQANRNGTESNKPLKVQLLEAEVQVSLLSDDVQRLQHVITEKDRTLSALIDLVERLKNGRLMRLLSWLHEAKKKMYSVLSTQQLQHVYFNRVEKPLYNFGILSTRELCLPDFLGIGAQRSGTTWLYANLRCHSDLYLPESKELHYFNRQFHTSLKSYSEKFEPGRQKLKGEITPAYAILPVERIQFIHRIMPEVKLIYIIRNPIDRTWSQALLELVWQPNRKYETVDEAEFFAFFRSEGIIQRCDYLANLNNWLSSFPHEQMYIGFFEDIVNRPRELLGEIFAHLGVSQEMDWNSFPYHQAHNKGPNIPMPQKYTDFLKEIYCQQIEAWYKYFGDRVAAWRCA